MGTGGINIMSQPISGASDNVALPDGMTMNNTVIGVKDAVGGSLLSTDIIEVARLINGVYVPTQVTGAGGSINFIINSAAYSSLQNAVTAAFTGQVPLLINDATTTNTTNLGGITILPGSIMNAATTGGNPAINLILTTGIIMDGLVVNETGTDSTAIQMNGDNVNNITLVNSRINSLGYSYLHNDHVADGSICANNIISAGYDGPNYNHPSVAASNITNIGNIVDTGGFGIAIARVNSYNMIGNIIRSSTNTSTTVAALHIEDLNTGGIVLGNHAMNCKGEGFSVQVPVIGKGTPGPMTSGFNQYKFTGVSKTNRNGIVCINDANGGVTQMGCIGSVVDGFDTGIVISDTQDMFVEGSVVNNCNTALFTAKHGRSFGTISCQGNTVLYTGQSGSMAGGFSSSTTPTSVITKSGGNFPGPAIVDEPIRLPIPVVHTGGSTQQWFTICPAPTGLSFVGVCRANVEGANGYFYENRYKWDGATLSKLVDGNMITLGLDVPGTGVVSGAAFRINSGNLQYGFTSSATVTQTGRFEFIGTWQQNT